MAEGLLLCKPSGVSFLFPFFLKTPSLKILIVLLRFRLFRKGGTGSLCRGIEHIGRDLHRRFAFERQHLGDCLAAKHQGGGKGEILHTACKARESVPGSLPDSLFL